MSAPPPEEWPGISFVIPVKNGEPWIERAIGAILAEAAGRVFEILIVDDGSVDKSVEIVRRFADQGVMRIVPGPLKGASTAINLGLKQARYPLIAQIDQDVQIRANWLALLVHEMGDPTVAAAQGYYIPEEGSSIWTRVMALDLAQRYSSSEKYVDHVCTGNTIYRAEALARVGYFDEGLGYGYDNDLSYRLGDLGYRLVRCAEARSVHHWRDTMGGYLVQQYGMGYGRIDLVFKHRRRYRGDDVSGFPMMMHAPLLLLALVALSGAAVAHVVGVAPFPFVIGGLGLLALLTAERAVSGVRAWRRFGEPAGLAFPLVHLFRDLVWAGAIVVWLIRRLFRIRSRPQHSMTR